MWLTLPSDPLVDENLGTIFKIKLEIRSPLSGPESDLKTTWYWVDFRAQ